MKTTTLNQSKNFFQKMLILSAVVAFSGFGFNSTAQTFDINVQQNSNCDQTVRAYNGTTLLLTMYPLSSGWNMSGCVSGTVTSIVVTDNLCNTVTFTANGLGFISYSSVNPSCSGCNCVSVTCAGGLGGGPCSANFLVELLP